MTTEFRDIVDKELAEIALRRGEKNGEIPVLPLLGVIQAENGKGSKALIDVLEELESPAQHEVWDAEVGAARDNKVVAEGERRPSPDRAMASRTQKPKRRRRRGPYRCLRYRQGCPRS